MKDLNSKKMNVFLLEIVSMSYLLLRSYQSIVFRCVPGKSEEFSKILLLIVWFLGIILGIIFFRHNKNNFSLLAILILPLGYYTIISTYETMWKFWVISFLMVVFSCLVYRRSYFNDDDITEKKIKRQRYYKSTCLALYVQTLIFIFQICVVGIFQN